MMKMTLMLLTIMLMIAGMKLTLLFIILKYKYPLIIKTNATIIDENTAQNTILMIIIIICITLPLQLR